MEVGQIPHNLIDPSWAGGTTRIRLQEWPKTVTHRPGQDDLKVFERNSPLAGIAAMEGEE